MESRSIEARSGDESRSYRLETSPKNESPACAHEALEQLASASAAVLQGDRKAALLSGSQTPSSQDPILERLTGADPKSLIDTIQEILIERGSDSTEYTLAVTRLTLYLRQLGRPDLNAAFCECVRGHGFQDPFIQTLIESHLVELASCGPLKRKRKEQAEDVSKESGKKLKEGLDASSNLSNEALRQKSPGLFEIAASEDLDDLMTGWLAEIGMYDCRSNAERQKLIATLTRSIERLVTHARQQGKEEVDQIIDRLIDRIHEIIDELDKYYDPVDELRLHNILEGRVKSGGELSLNEMIARADEEEGALQKLPSNDQQEPAGLAHPLRLIFSEIESGRVDLSPLSKMTCSEVIKGLPIMFAGLKSEAHVLPALRTICFHLLSREELGLDTFGEGNRDDILSKQLGQSVETLPLRSVEERAVVSELLAPFGVAFVCLEKTTVPLVTVTSIDIANTFYQWSLSMHGVSYSDMCSVLQLASWTVKEKTETGLLLMRLFLGDVLQKIVDPVDARTAIKDLSPFQFADVLSKVKALLGDIASEEKIKVELRAPVETVYFGTPLEDQLIEAKKIASSLKSAPVRPETVETLASLQARCAACVYESFSHLTRDQKIVVKEHMDQIALAFNGIHFKSIHEEAPEELKGRLKSLHETIMGDIAKMLEDNDLRFEKANKVNKHKPIVPYFGSPLEDELIEAQMIVSSLKSKPVTKETLNTLSSLLTRCLKSASRSFPNLTKHLRHIVKIRMSRIVDDIDRIQTNACLENAHQAVSDRLERFARTFEKGARKIYGGNG